MSIKEKNPNKPLFAIIGMGRSGISAAKVLKKEGKEVLIIEQKKTKKLMEIAYDLRKLNIKVELGRPLEIESFKPWLSNISQVITSPSVNWDNLTLNQFRSIGIKVQGEIAMAFERLKDIPWIGITGTNGKTTVTEMINHIFTKNNIYAPSVGNIGYPASEIILNNYSSNNSKPEWLIVELSSYQIESANNIKPKIGVWTTFSPDHLERHKTIDNYFKIKKLMIENSFLKILNYDDNFLKNNYSNFPQSSWISTTHNYDNKKNIEFYVNKDGLICESSSQMFKSNIINLPGSHNLQNLLLAIAASRKAGLSSNQIREGIFGFKGLPHRIEFVGKISQTKIYNDSKATNFDSSCVGLYSIKLPALVIAGGIAKSGCSKKWVKTIKETASGILLFGESSLELSLLLKESGYEGRISIFKNLNDASYEGFELLKEFQFSSLILSPACSSFDQYENFEERGNHFKFLVKDWLKNQ